MLKIFNIFGNRNSMKNGRIKSVFASFLVGTMAVCSLNAHPHHDHSVESKLDSKEPARVYYTPFIRYAVPYMVGVLGWVFDNTREFECDSDARSAECRVDEYYFDNSTVRDFRYVMDYKDSRVIERISGKVEYESDEYSPFMPKEFECSSFGLYDRVKGILDEQFVCDLKGDYYNLDFKIKAKFESKDLFTNRNAMALMLQNSLYVDDIVLGNQDIYENLYNRQDDDDIVARVKKLNKTLSKINANVYSVEVNIKKPQLPEKMYEYLFADMIDDEKYMSKVQSRKYNQISRTFYNTGVGYIYGNAMGYVLGNDLLLDRTKEGLNKALVAMRDSAMLDSNVSRVHIKATNRTKEGVNLADLLNAMSMRLTQFNNTQLKKEHVGKAINAFDADILNRYRIEVGVYRFR